MRPSLTIAVLASTLALGACKKPAEPAAAPADACQRPGLSADAAALLPPQLAGRSLT